MIRRKALVLNCLSLVMVCVLGSSASATWKEKVLYSFQGIPDGSLPVGGMVFDKAGNLYGATTEGGSSSCISVAQCGTVFQLARPVKQGDPWTETVLYVFKGNASQDGASPAGGLVMDSAGNLYGTTAYGGTGNCVLLGTLMGCGAVFELSPPKQKGGKWTEKVIYSFPTAKQGYLPQGDLVFDAAGNLYGATEFGGGHGTTCNGFYQYCGAVFKLSPPKTKGGKWTERVLHGFASGKDGADPNGGLILDSNGNVYGTSFGGGNENGPCKGVGCGTVFELKPPATKGGDWTEKVLHRFNGQDGGGPAAPVVFDVNGNLYGTAVAGPGQPFGMVFELKKPFGKVHSWKEIVLHAFDHANSDGTHPAAGVLFDAKGDLYGATAGPTGQTEQGNVFELKPPGKEGGTWMLSVIYTFTGNPDGATPSAKLLFGKSGTIFSTTQAGGGNQACPPGGCGTVFEVSP